MKSIIDRSQGFLPDFPFIPRDYKVGFLPPAVERHFNNEESFLPRLSKPVATAEVFDSMRRERLLAADTLEWDYDKCQLGDFAHKTAVRVRESGGSLTKVDWITATFPEADHNDRLYNALFDLCVDAGLSVHGRSKGMHCYTQSAAIQYHSDVSGTSTNVGHIAWGRQGLMFELSGLGCEYVRSQFVDLVNMIIFYSGRLTRLDLALDLSGDYCEAWGITVPTLLTRAKAGEFASKYAPEHAKQTIDLAGDWSDFVCGVLSTVDYSPADHCPKGLTAYVGGKTAENQLVIYEKGKQLLGMVDKDQYLEYSRKLQTMRTAKSRASIIRKMETLTYNPDYDHDRSWVRIERRIRRGSNKKDISLAMVLDPDGAFVSGFPGLQALYAGYRENVHAVYRDFEEYRAVGLDKHESLVMTRKVFWAKRQYGRLVKSMQNEGLTAGDIVELLTRADGLKEYIFDLLDES